MFTFAVRIKEMLHNFIQISLKFYFCLQVLPVQYNFCKILTDIAGYIPSATPSGSTTPTPSGSAEAVSEKAGYLLYSGQAAALGVYCY